MINDILDRLALVIRWTLGITVSLAVLALPVLALWSIIGGWALLIPVIIVVCIWALER